MSQTRLPTADGSHDLTTSLSPAPGASPSPPSEEDTLPKAPLPAEVAELFAQPNPAVVAVLRPDGSPMSVATWCLLEDDGTVLLNMDAGRARLRWMRERPEVALTALKGGEWYTHVSVRGPNVRWEDDPEKGLADIDRLSMHYGGNPYPEPGAAAGELLDAGRPLARLGRGEGGVAPGRRRAM